MLILFIAYLGGVLTILSPCILPVLPFVLARADRPFRSHGLPMLVGMALAFAVVATLAAVGGGWIVTLNEYGRYAAMALLALFGATLLFPRVAERLSRPLVALGLRISDAPQASVFSPLWLGVGTGLLWAPCAGPILGLILTGAALNGASVGTSLLLLAYAAGACTSLAVALLSGGRLLSALKRTLPTGDGVRRLAGAAVLAGVGAIALGLDTGWLARLSLGTTSTLEQALVDTLRQDAPQAQRADTGFVRVADTRPAPVPARELRVEGRLPSLAGATEWINSAPLTPEALRGKVVLVDFWTYSCINCLRTLPYVRAWADKYRDAGLVVLGVHAPEFAFEKNPANVRKAVKDLGIGFPVALDNDFSIWRGFDNQAWPAFYFVDAQGRIRHHQFGENRYDKAEQVIQQLLAEAGQAQVADGLVAPQGQGTQAAPGAEPAQSGETYLGHARAHGFASPGGIARDRAKAYEPVVSSLRTNQWSLGGDWTVEGERAVLNQAHGRIAYRFKARDLHLVLGPMADGKPVRFTVRVDGQPPLADHGADTDAQGHGVVDAQKLYQLVRQSAGGGKERLFEIEFLDAGAQAYAFTFG
ncbi:cytochrome c biogenesis protein CcdA/thiol-disulfide isomerase/thioredoxin [Variovorax boronicumulans]|uniref:Cytochrome c biogenesis protein CcdA/thiol-disulfide isomerase/thioredoxin n=1 Tax=Variovorax boronicumulans TaxID=436515 RepID=A0AAW8E374_9BURK|nr:cytochrome c biogenesis protein DipZ [Variovorax boronicumulans]MDP9880717.1 cytochrome c biogenesis protein CcdA/thiol-disulfide isomerase/thioredoxin [Variovorax boronicumulans]MDP9920216.1 cytochrome c biogenesis protein CcdA/thiol-disulfide isomerase/thioredoxin [Variovorax boronicumulans]MDP9926004.1 cytochrome c biogenesis protein CcdA/thiol-disulfide isomerase/thioredoxin [Variovorax boronicumulans]